MSLGLLKNAMMFAWTEFSKNKGSWFVLTCFTFGMYIVRGLLKDALMYSLEHIQLLPDWSYWLVVLTSIPIAYVIAYWYIAFVNIINRNALDAVQGNSLRMLTNIVASHALVALPVVLMLISVLIVSPALLYFIMLADAQSGGLYWILLGRIVTIVSVSLALYVLMRCSFAVLVILDKNVSVGQALSNSWILTQNNTGLLIASFLGTIFINILVVFCISLLFKFISSLVAQIAMIVWLLFFVVQLILIMASLYEQMKSQKESL